MFAPFTDRRRRTIKNTLHKSQDSITKHDGHKKTTLNLLELEHLEKQVCFKYTLKKKKIFIVFFLFYLFFLKALTESSELY